MTHFHSLTFLFFVFVFYDMRAQLPHSFGATGPIPIKIHNNTSVAVKAIWAFCLIVYLLIKNNYLSAAKIDKNL